MLEGDLVLTKSGAGGYTVAKRKFCGFEWEAEATESEDVVNITLWCNRGVEGSLWRCAAVVTVHTQAVSNGTASMRKVVSNYHRNYRSVTITVPRLEVDSDIKITFELRNISGYRDAMMFETDFSKPSESSNICIAFENSDRRVYVSKEYLSINSQKFATLFALMTSERPASPTSNSNESDYGDDFDVLNIHTSVQNDSLEENDFDCSDLLSQGDGHSRSASAAAVCQEDGVILLAGVDAEDFIILLKAIYPPFREITRENVESLLATAFRFGVEHILWKCEIYLRSDESQHYFDLFQRLVFATTYKMASLESDCLRTLSSANDVRLLLDDPRMESAPQELRSLLLETLLQRFKCEARPAIPKATSTSKAAQTYVCNLFKSKGVPGKNCVSTCTESAQNKPSSSSTDEGVLVGNKINKEGMLRNLEMSLKCTQDFIRDVEKKNTVVEANADLSASFLPTTCDTPAETSFVEEKPPVPPRRRKCEEASRYFIKELVYETINACKLSKERSIVLGYTRKAYSAHDIFADLVLPPFSSMRTVIYSFVTHLFTKLYGERVIPIVRSHLSKKLNAFPSPLAERVATAIIFGYELDVQLGNDDLLIHELKIYLQKQLKTEFNLFCENIRAGYLSDSFV